MLVREWFLLPGKQLSLETRSRMTAYAKDRPSVHKKKIHNHVIAMGCMSHTPEANIKRSVAASKRKLTDSMKESISLALKGRKLSTQHKNKIAAALRRRYAR